MIEVDPRLKGVLEKESKEESQSPGGGVTRVQAKAVYNLQFQMIADGFRIMSDEKYNKGGTDIGPAPIRFFLAGILMNLQVKCVKEATLKGIALEALDGDIACHRNRKTSPSDLATFEKITLDLHVKSSEPDSRIIEIVEDSINQSGSINAVGIVPVAFKLMHNEKVVLDKTLLYSEQEQLRKSDRM